MAIQLPNDVVIRIVSFMDIDTRRSFGIYSKLTVPVDLAVKISTCYQQVQVTHNENIYGTNGDSYWISLNISGSCVYDISHDIYQGRTIYYIIHHRFSRFSNNMFQTEKYFYGYDTKLVKNAEFYMNSMTDFEQFADCLFAN